MPARIQMEVIVKMNRLPAIRAAIPLILARETSKTAEIIKDQADIAMQSPKSGMHYYVVNHRTGSYGWHQASSPGEAPAVLSGHLKDSASVDSIPQGQAVTWDTDYAAALEFGAGRIAPRPFARPAATKAFPGFVSRVANAIRSV
jgi:hypothetical protein